MKSVYLIGSLRNSKIPRLASRLEQQLGIEVFDSWFSPGPEADSYWRKYEKLRGRSYKQALNSYAAKHVFEFDKFNIDRCDAGLLIMPAGRSGHLELGYMLGQGKPGYILFDKEPSRWDVMVQFATAVFFNEKELYHTLSKHNQKT